MVDIPTPFSDFTDQSYVNDANVFVAETAAGSGVGVNIPGSAFVKRNSSGIIVPPTGMNFKLHKLVASQSDVIAEIGYDSTDYTVRFHGAYSGTPNAALTAITARMNSVTARSINVPGTVNAGGADYAEYVLKADGCGEIAKGDVCGIDRAGRLTKSWGAAICYVVKSTDPSYVGGDRWDAAAGPRPEQGKDESDLAFAARLSAWEALFEAVRQTVDRIAFCGQVPVNVDAETRAACDAALTDGSGIYLVAVANGGGIAATAVLASEMTIELYMRRLGKVWAVRDGQAIIDVQHG